MMLVVPMRSQAQRAYLHIHHPEIAARFEAETPKGTKLPQHAAVVNHLRKRMKGRRRGQRSR